MQMKLNSELFILPARKNSENDCQFFLYAPLRRILVRLNSENLLTLKRLLDGKLEKTDEELPLVKSLVGAGVIDGQEEKKPSSFEDKPYCPNGVTLFLSSSCGMACRYCYAGQGNAEKTKKLEMPLSLAYAAIEEVIGNAHKRRLKHFNLGFHGGGEPTFAWETLKSSVEYAKKKAAANGMQVNISMSTGAAFSPQKARWIAQNFTNVSISLDGPPHIQDKNRPMKNGDPSSQLLIRTMKIFDRMKFSYAIQATVVSDQVGEMADTVRWFSGNTSAKMIKFEPVSNAGSFSRNKNLVPSSDSFAENFIKACEAGAKLGIGVNFSGVRLQANPVSTFCGAFAEPFSVTPDGKVSACFEAFESGTPYAGLFIFGKWDAQAGKFRFDLEKLEILRRRNIYRLESCRFCFCKYSCGGDCATRNFRMMNDEKIGPEHILETGARCEVIREITRHSLSSIIDKTSQQSELSQIPFKKD